MQSRTSPSPARRVPPSQRGGRGSRDSPRNSARAAKTGGNKREKGADSPRADWEKASARSSTAEWQRGNRSSSTPLRAGLLPSEFSRRLLPNGAYSNGSITATVVQQVSSPTKPSELTIRKAQPVWNGPSGAATSPAKSIPSPVSVSNQPPPEVLQAMQQLQEKYDQALADQDVLMASNTSLSEQAAATADHLQAVQNALSLERQEKNQLMTQLQMAYAELINTRSDLVNTQAELQQVISTGNSSSMTPSSTDKAKIISCVVQPNILPNASFSWEKPISVNFFPNQDTLK